MIACGTLKEQVKVNKCKLTRAHLQVALLDEQISQIQIRYKYAKTNRQKPFRQSLQMRLSVVSGVRMMFAEYASSISQKVALLEGLIEDVEGGHDSDADSGINSSMDED